MIEQLIYAAILFIFICGTVFVCDLIYRRGTERGAQMVMDKLHKAHFHIDILYTGKIAQFEIRLITAKTKKEKDPTCKTAK